MTTYRKVYGYETDSARPGLKSDREFDLDSAGVGCGTVPAAAAVLGVSAAERGSGIVHQTVLTLSSVVITTVDAGAAGAQGGLEVYDFPAGVLHWLGGSCDLTTLAGAGGIADTGALVGSLGTVVAAFFFEAPASTE